MINLRDILKEGPRYKSKILIFVAGLSRSKSVAEQVALIGGGFDKIISFEGNSSRENQKNILNALKENPDAYVMLFSLGTHHATAIAKKMQARSKLYIVEPYPDAKTYVNGAEGANLYWGTIRGTGYGLYTWGQLTPGADIDAKWKMQDHWGALGAVGRVIAGRL